jgi:hypothetical protein
MLGRPPAPYPDPDPEKYATQVLEQGVRGEGHYTKVSTGDFYFNSGHWQTIHGAAIVARCDRGAFMVWGAKLPDGNRIYCCRSRLLYGYSHWRRRSANGRSWLQGQVAFEPDDVFFSDGVHAQPIQLNDNVFEIAMASKPEFIRELKDDAVARSLMALLRNDAICSLDGTVAWNPTSGEAAYTIGRLRGFGEPELEFKYEYPIGEPLRVDPDVLRHILNNAGWRIQTEDEMRRYAPHWFND